MLILISSLPPEKGIRISKKPICALLTLKMSTPELDLNLYCMSAYVNSGHPLDPLISS